MAETDKPVVCLECGKKNAPGASKCRECGEPLPRTGVTAKQPSRPRPPADDEEDDRPRRRRPAEDEDDEEDDRPRGRSVRKEAEYDPGAASLLVPVGVSPWAVAAGYLGLVGCVPFLGIPFALLAILCGVIALTKGRGAGAIGKASGVARAIFGIVCGGLGLLVSLVGVLASLLGVR